MIVMFIYLNLRSFPQRSAVEKTQKLGALTVCQLFDRLSQRFNRLRHCFNRLSQNFNRLSLGI